MRMGGIKKCILVLLCLILALPALSWAITINEDEPNNSLFSANTVKKNKEYLGDAYKQDQNLVDQDWFAFNATKDNATINLDFKNNNATGTWRVKLRNEETDLLFAQNINATLNSTRLLSKGLYYLKVKPNDFVNGQNYSFKVTGDIVNPGELPTEIRDDSIWEAEINDKWYQANQIKAKPNKNTSYKYAGNVKSSDDKDWFKFYVGQECTINLKDFKIKESSTKDGNNTKGWTIKVYNDDIELPASSEKDWSYRWEKNEGSNAFLGKSFYAHKKGIYYLQVSVDGAYYRNLVFNGTGLSSQVLPIADAGEDKTIGEEESYTLDATVRGDEEDYDYEWELLHPNDHTNSTYTLTNMKSRDVDFDVSNVPPEGDEFTFELTVRNGTADEYYDKDRVTITIEDTYDGGGSSEGGCSFAPDANLGWGWVSLLIVVAALPFIRKRIVN